MKLLDQFGLEGLSSQLSNGSKRYKIDARCVKFNPLSFQASFICLIHQIDGLHMYIYTTLP